MYNNIENNTLLEEKQCRICLEDDNPNDMINPCLCKGTQKYVHRECLNQWRSVNVNPKAFTHCTVCNYEYKTITIDSGNIKFLEKINKFLVKNFFTFLFLNQVIIFFFSFFMLILDVNNNIKYLIIKCDNVTSYPYSFNSDYQCIINYYILSIIIYFSTLVIAFICNIFYNKNKKLYFEYYKGFNYFNFFGMIIVSIITFIIWLPLGIFFFTLALQSILKFHYDTIDKKIKAKNITILNYEPEDIEIKNIEINTISDVKLSIEDESNVTKIDIDGNLYEEASV